MSYTLNETLHQTVTPFFDISNANHKHFKQFKVFPTATFSIFLGGMVVFIQNTALAPNTGFEKQKKLLFSFTPK